MRIIFVPIAMLCGCSMNGGLLSAEHCSHIAYLRNGSQMHVEADCTLPVVGPQLPISPATLINGAIP